jgi:uncharacterized membrane protein
MSQMEKSIEVNVPVRKAYDQWTQFEQFPRFMEGIEEVRQIDDKRLHWKAKIAGKTVEWDAEIVEQLPDTRISWRSTSGARNDGTVRFEKLGENRSRIFLRLDVEPHGLGEKIGDAIGTVSSRVETNLKRFKEFVESLPAETGAWRGEIHGGVVQPPHQRPNA